MRSNNRFQFNKLNSLLGSGVIITKVVYDKIIKILAILGGLLFGSMVIFITIDVILRNSQGKGLFWVTEMMEYAMYCATAFSAPWLVREHGHISVDIVIEAMPIRGRRLLSCAAYIVSALIAAILAYFSLKISIQMYVNENMLIKSFKIPEWIVYVVLVLGFSLTAVEFARSAYLKLKENPS